MMPIAAYGSTFEQNCERLQKIFDRSRAGNLKLTSAKNVTCVPIKNRPLKLIGFVVSKEGIAAEPCKMRDIERWSRPENLTALRSWLAMCSYIPSSSHFPIRRNSETAVPLIHPP
jgi:hypothetical protein